MTLRRRLGLTVAPLVGLVLALGGAGVGLLDDLGHRSDAILRENYVSLGAMARLNEHLANADKLALMAVVQGDRLHPDVRAEFRRSLDAARAECRVELANVTVPSEQEAAERLAARVEEVAARGEALLATPAAERLARFTDPAGGFQANVTAAWHDLQTVRALNEAAMYEADQAARATARRSVRVLAAGTLTALLATGLLSWRTGRAILTPVEDLTRSARAVAAGDLTYRVQATESGGELGELGRAFNDMADQLWLVRQTNVKELMRAREAAQAVIDSLPGPVLLVDPGGTVELANPTARRVFGVEPGRGWVPPDPLRGPLADALETRRPFVAERFDQALIVKDGAGELALLPQVRPVGDAGAAVVLDDVTRFRLLDQLKGDFVATAGHELKTPLTGLQLAVHLLLEEAAGPLAPKQIELLADARENAERLRTLVDQLLALARLEDRRELLSIGPHPAEELLRAAADAAAVRAADKSVTLTVAVPPDLPAVAADPVRLGTALDNLLTNAVTYTPPGGTVTLSASAADGTVSLVVADTGPGIPPEHRPRVFERFFRVPDPARPPGTGLGLAIVREVAEAHGGTVRCDSTSAGTTFTLTLPAWPT